MIKQSRNIAERTRGYSWKAGVNKPKMPVTEMTPKHYIVSPETLEVIIQDQMFQLKTKVVKYYKQRRSKTRDGWSISGKFSINQNPVKCSSFVRKMTALN